MRSPPSNKLYHILYLLTILLDLIRYVVYLAESDVSYSISLYLIPVDVYAVWSASTTVLLDIKLYEHEPKASAKSPQASHLYLVVYSHWSIDRDMISRECNERQYYTDVIVAYVPQ